MTWPYCAIPLIFGLIGIVTFSTGISKANYWSYIIGGIEIILSSAAFAICVGLTIVHYLGAR